jgi:hypothetical protein
MDHFFSSSFLKVTFCVFLWYLIVPIHDTWFSCVEGSGRIYLARKTSFPDEFKLMSIATYWVICYRPKYPEAVAVMLFNVFGEYVS